MHEAVIISSFVGLALREVRALDATIRMGYLMGSDTYNPIVRFREAYPLFALKSHGCQAWHPYFKLPVIDWAISQTQNAGYAVNVWTVNETHDMQKLLTLKVAGIITDKPDVLKKIITPGV